MKKIIKWNCRFHPSDWWHEVGCPHQKWSLSQLEQAAEMAIESGSLDKAEWLNQEIKWKLKELM